LTHCGQSILRKINKFDATRCQILRLKCTKFDFRRKSLQRSPDSLAVFKGPTSKNREEKEGRGRVRGGEGAVGKGPGPPNLSA